MSDHLVFSSKTDADSAQEKISQNMGFTGSLTTQWDIPRQRVTDGKWYFLKPESNFMSGVAKSTTEQFSVDWLPKIVVA